MRKQVSGVRSSLSKRLTPTHKLWLSMFRHGELPWQRRVLEFVASARDGQSVRDRRSLSGEPVGYFYDARREVDLSLAVVRMSLRSAELELVELPRIGHFRPVLAVDSADVEEVCQALEELRNSVEWSVTPLNRAGEPLGPKRVRTNPSAVASIACVRRVLVTADMDLSTPEETVTVQFWERSSGEVREADGASYPRGTMRRLQDQRDSLIEYVAPDVWRDAVEDGGLLELPAPHVFSVEEPVDIVYTWVDSGDPEWSRRMESARAGLEVSGSAASPSRYTSRNELKYSLRSVEYYASWCNHIYIVTDGQTPPWLDTSNPKVTIVDHRQIFSNPESLPVFNSHAIESQLHHIPGLSERYVYLNDDVFFLRPTEPSDFFTGNGLSTFFLSIVPIDIGPVSEADLPVVAAAKQGRSHMINQYARTATHRFKHTPHPQLRSVLDEMEREHPELFDSVAASTFRNPGDFSIPSSLYHYEAYLRRRAIPGDVSYQFVDLAAHDLRLRLQRVGRSRELDVFCLNETDLQSHGEEEIDRTAVEFLQARFPVPSSFEL